MWLRLRQSVLLPDLHTSSTLLNLLRMCYKHCYLVRQIGITSNLQGDSKQLKMSFNNTCSSIALSFSPYPFLPSSFVSSLSLPPSSFLPCILLPPFPFLPAALLPSFLPSPFLLPPSFLPSSSVHSLRPAISLNPYPSLSSTSSSYPVLSLLHPLPIHPSPSPSLFQGTERWAARVSRSVLRAFSDSRFG